jgi:prophage antirepressor-like protein
MTRQANDLPCVQFFYRDGLPLRVVAVQEEVWFSVKDVIRHMGSDADECGAAALLEAMGMTCCVIPCADGGKTISLVCMAEGDLMRLFDKMERFEARPG